MSLRLCCPVWCGSLKGLTFSGLIRQRAASYLSICLRDYLRFVWDLFSFFLSVRGLKIKTILWYHCVSISEAWNTTNDRTNCGTFQLQRVDQNILRVPLKECVHLDGFGESCGEEWKQSSSFRLSRWVASPQLSIIFSAAWQLSDGDHICFPVRQDPAVCWWGNALYAEGLHQHKTIK